MKLHHSLAESLDTDHGVIAQFVAPEPDAAIESVVYDLAYISAAWLGKRVLFVNGVGMRFDGSEQGRPTRQEPTLAGELSFHDIESSITRVVGLELYQMNFPQPCAARWDWRRRCGRFQFLARLRDSFDLVVIASPAASEAPMGILLSRFVDGNILVLEAGRTRAPVAAELRDALSASGGAVVGAVLTRYHSNVPRCLRRWL